MLWGDEVSLPTPPPPVTDFGNHVTYAAVSSRSSIL